MKKICILLALFMALAPGYVFSAPKPPDLIGTWEGPGKFLVEFESYPGEVEVNVSLEITEQAGTKFKGVISAYFLAETGDRIYLGGEPDMVVGGHIQGGQLTGTQSRTINMFGGRGGTITDIAPRYLMEIDGQYQVIALAPFLGTRIKPRPALICNWRGMNFWVEANPGTPSVGEFTLHKITPAPID
jgi:hypothetical protein